MKTTLRYLVPMIAALSFSACDDDEKPKTVPEVTTATPSDVTTTSATVGGQIVKDGNASITVTGIVYSSIVAEPTIADNKIELADLEDDFSTLLDGLSSGTTYHVRAYATNSVGTGYGEVVDFTTANAAPTATAASVTGTAEVNKVLTGTYTYSDAEGDAESGSTFKWYVANDATGSGEAAIMGATAVSYTVQAADQGKFIRFGVTPKAATGNTTGEEVKSAAFAGPIGEPTTVTFMYNGQSVTYGIISSGVTGKKWLDRNLGAPNTPAALDDYANYGHLFQWGRLADGHQVITRTGTTNADMSAANGTTTTTMPFQTSSDDDPGHSLFIVITGQAPNDWRVPQNDNLWQGVNGINNPCPTGWRIPTQAEFAAENFANLTEAFNGLKFTATGQRAIVSPSGGGVEVRLQFSTNGYYWTSTMDNTTSQATHQSANYVYRLTNFSTAQGARASGYACRCIKD